MSVLLKAVETKDNCLAGWCRERVSALSGITTQWDQLQPLIDNHTAAMRVQIDIVKNQIDFQLANLKDETEKFLIRWESMISDLETNDQTDMKLFKERQMNWQTIQEQKNKLETQGAKYGMSFPPDIEELFSKLSEDVSNKGQQWEYFEDFLKEFDQIGNEEWTVYRRRPYILTDFITKWSNSVNGQTNQSSKRIRQALDAYHSAIPTLQQMQSDGLTERHWAQIFRILNQPTKSYHDIQLKDVLSDVNRLVQESTEIQHLVRKAASEQIVRQALAELDQWGVNAKLKTTLHMDSKSNNLTVIKDFQDVLNKIGDNQCLLQSAKNSSAFDSYSDQAEIWESRLATLDHILTSLSQIQRK